MRKIEEALWQNYEEVNNKLNDVNPKNDNYVELAEERDKIRNELIKIKQIEIENENSKIKIQSENKRDFIHNIISVSTFTVSTLITIWGINKTFRFDQDSTVTSTLGRNILNGVIQKMLKR